MTAVQIQSAAEKVAQAPAGRALAKEDAGFLRVLANSIEASLEGFCDDHNKTAAQLWRITAAELRRIAG